MKGANELSIAKPIKKSELLPGGVYTGKSLEKRVFVGQVSDGEKTALLWFEIWGENFRITETKSIYKYKLTKDCSVVKKVGDIKIDPAKLLQSASEAAEKHLHYCKKCVADAKDNGRLQEIYQKQYDDSKKKYSVLMALTLVGA